MTTGALMFAFNNEGTDYLRIAAWNAGNIRRHLKIPVAVVTDEPDADFSAFDQVITVDKQGTDVRYFEDLDQTVTWYNANRPDAWDLTPWDRTLLLDADYVIASSYLSRYLSSNIEVMAYKSARDITSRDTFNALNTFGRHNIATWWATVIIFQRNNFAQFVFDSMKMIRANWQHYRDVYGINSRTYRNDFAFTIALGIVQGHADYIHSFPTRMASATPDTELICYQEDCYEIRWRNTNNQKTWLRWNGLDFHAMGKHSLEKIAEAH